jgi:hypothetical protein
LFQVGEWPLELIIGLLNILKNDFGEVDEAMFQGVERPCELIIFPGHLKKRLGRSRLRDVSSGRMTLRSHNLPSGRLRNDFGEVDGAMFQRVEILREIISCILVIEKSDLDEVA